MRYICIDRRRRQYAVRMMCRVLKVSRSGYYGIDKLTRRRGLALPDGDCSAPYVDAGAHAEGVLTSKDA